MTRPADSFDLESLRRALADGRLAPGAVVEDVLARIAAAGDDAVWISRVPADALEARAAELERAGPDGLALWGVPFAVKDNFDVAGLTTTAACPDFAYEADETAPAVQRLLDAGAILVGKTNMDQFATGLVGVRTPYGAPKNPFDARYVPGGSSAGSAVAVARGLVAFALGTDTAGSGRVPAAFNNIVGLKPTRGLLSTRGVVPACRSLDCVSIFALTAADADDVLAVVRGFDAADPYSRTGAAAKAVPAAPGRLRFAVPRADQLEFFGNDDACGLFDAAAERLETLGATRCEIDFAPFLETARLLYEGPWVAERYLAARELIETRPMALHPVTRQIIGAVAGASATDAFAAQYRLQTLKRRAEAVWDDVDVLLTPTAPTVYTLAEVESEPLRRNADLGYYTNFMNLLDLCGIAVPAGFQSGGLPFGVTIAAPAFHDEALLGLGEALHHASPTTMGATGAPVPPPRLADADADADPGCVLLAVCGAHMTGLPLNHQLAALGARLVRACRTAPEYHLFALDRLAPPRPGLVRAEPGSAIEVELWSVPEARLGAFVHGLPAPLAIGTVKLEDGRLVKGFLCEAHATEGARDISHLGGWRAYLAETCRST